METSTSPAIAKLPELMDLIRHSFRESDFLKVESSLRSILSESETEVWRLREGLYLSTIDDLSEQLRETEDIQDRYLDLLTDRAYDEERNQRRIQDLESELGLKEVFFEEMLEMKDYVLDLEESRRKEAREVEEAKLLVEIWKEKCVNLEAEVKEWKKRFSDYENEVVWLKNCKEKRMLGERPPSGENSDVAVQVGGLQQRKANPVKEEMIQREIIEISDDNDDAIISVDNHEEGDGIELPEGKNTAGRSSKMMGWDQQVQSNVSKTRLNQPVDLAESTSKMNLHHWFFKQSPNRSEKLKHRFLRGPAQPRHKRETLKTG